MRNQLRHGPFDRRLQAVRATGPITLDGALDEPAWEAAPIATRFIQNDPREGEPATYNTEVRVIYDADAIYVGVFARDAERYKRSYSVGHTVRANENLAAAFSIVLNDVDVPTGSFVSKLLTARVNYSVNTRTFFNALVQYNSDNHQWTSNLRFNVIHRPLSDFFLVYNEGRDERTGQMLSRAIIAKMTYLVAF